MRNHMLLNYLYLVLSMMVTKITPVNWEEKKIYDKLPPEKQEEID